MRAVLVASLVVAREHVAVAYAVAFGVSVGTIFFNPASSSLIHDVVAEDELVDANASLWTVAVVAQILLAPLAGGPIAWAGVGAAFALNAASYVVSALLLRLRPTGTGLLAGSLGVLARTGAAYVYAWLV